MTSAPRRAPSAWALRLGELRLRRLPWLALVRVRYRLPGRDEIHCDWGTGILVDRDRVLTCFHVVHAAGQSEGPRRSRSEPLPRSNVEMEIEVDLGREIGIFRAVEIVAEDDRLDLALLRLDAAAIGPRAPPVSAAAIVGDVDAWMIGFEGGPDWRCTHVTRRLDPANETKDGTRGRSGVHDFGLEAGYSGAPILVERDGAPILFGMIDIGGLGTSIGGYVAADALRGFLAAAGIDFAVAETGDPADAWCRLEGYERILASPRRDLVADHHAVPSSRGVGLHYRALHPVTAPVAAGAIARPATRRLAAHLADGAEIDRLLALLRAETGLPLRLPTHDEFQDQCLGAPEPNRVVGRPVSIDDYGSADGRLRAPPDGCAEWVEDHGRRSLLLRRGEDLLEFPDAAALARAFPHLRAVLRTALSAGRTPS